MSEHADSEIKRLPLDSLVLDLKSMMPDSSVVPVLQVRGGPISGCAARCGIVLVGADEGVGRGTGAAVCVLGMNVGPGLAVGFVDESVSTAADI